ncbi:CDP-glycerol glycerophosphotransferase family protein [Streptomyces sp. NPDC088817]|uniref:CDP-glycerol glycerophosphotransferase family protein n=1 Tax=Streptomyces sp. NPDC088817 TaxID=3365907 RepID=UPI003809A680
MARLFTSGDWRDAESARLRTGLRERFCEFDDGWAAERVVRTLILGDTEWTPDPAAAPAASGKVAHLPAQASGRDRTADRDGLAAAGGGGAAAAGACGAPARGGRPRPSSPPGEPGEGAGAGLVHLAGSYRRRAAYQHIYGFPSDYDPP